MLTVRSHLLELKKILKNSLTGSHGVCLLIRQKETSLLARPGMMLHLLYSERVLHPNFNYLGFGDAPIETDKEILFTYLKELEHG